MVIGLDLKAQAISDSSDRLLMVSLADIFSHAFSSCSPEPKGEFKKKRGTKHPWVKFAQMKSHAIFQEVMITRCFHFFSVSI